MGRGRYLPTYHPLVLLSAQALSAQTFAMCCNRLRRQPMVSILQMFEPVFHSSQLARAPLCMSPLARAPLCIFNPFRQPNFELPTFSCPCCWKHGPVYFPSAYCRAEVCNVCGVASCPECPQLQPWTEFSYEHGTNSS